MTGHVFWKKGDTGLPDCLTDRNGDIVLGMCKVCGQAEADLADSCPIIPENKWPDGAVALVWDQHGRGKALVRDEPWWSWFLVNVSIPMPDGWDWRVPAMRQQVPTIDLGQGVSEKPQKGRCPNNAAPGGCQLPNRFCTFPSCDKADALQPTKTGTSAASKVVQP